MIYFTEFGSNSDYNFSRSEESVLMAGQRLRCWPTPKRTILKYSPIFQVSDNLHTSTEIKHENYMQISPISHKVITPRYVLKT